MFKTIKENSTAEVVEKKSKFIANIYYIESVEQVEELLKETRKKYFDARHICFVYSICTEEGVVNKFSDDGEPSGTAGAPMLNIITSKELSNILIIVTRYFGGILLGTGGLVRAYTEASTEALKKCDFIEKDIGIEVKFEVTYTNLEKLKYYFRQNNIHISNVDYKEKICVKAEMTEKFLEEIISNRDNLNFNIVKHEVIEKKYIEVIKTENSQ